MILNRNSAKFRELLWLACKNDGNGKVYCNLCHGEVLPTDEWHESHIGAPKALDGNSIGIAHAKCNLDDGRRVTGFVAKAKRMFRKHVGIVRRGIGDNPLSAGKRSGVTKKLNGSVEPRLTGSQKHARLMAERYSFGGSE